MISTGKRLKRTLILMEQHQMWAILDGKPLFQSNGLKGKQWK